MSRRPSKPTKPDPGFTTAPISPPTPPPPPQEQEQSSPETEVVNLQSGHQKQHGPSNPHLSNRTGAAPHNTRHAAAGASSRASGAAALNRETETEKQTETERARRGLGVVAGGADVGSERQQHQSPASLQNTNPAPHARSAQPTRPTPHQRGRSAQRQSHRIQQQNRLERSSPYPDFYDIDLSDNEGEGEGDGEWVIEGKVGEEGGGGQEEWEVVGDDE